MKFSVYSFIFAAEMVIGVEEINAKLSELGGSMFVFPQRTGKELVCEKGMQVFNSAGQCCQ